MLVRTRDKNVAEVFTGNEFFIESGSRVPSPAWSVTRVQLDVMTDVVTPGFRKRSGKGEIINSPLTQHKSRERILPTNVLLTPVPGIGRPWGLEGSCGPVEMYSLFAPDMPDSEKTRILDEITRLEQLAVTEAYGGVGSPDVASLTELAELRETIGFLSSPVKGMVSLTKRFGRYIKAFQAREARAATRLARWNALPDRVKAKRAPPAPVKHPPFRVRDMAATDLSSAWLAYRYGLMPLIYTFQDVHKMLIKRATGQPLRATSRGKATTTVDLSREVTHAYGWGGGGYSIRYDRDLQCKIECRGGVLYETDTSLTSALGIGWSHIPKAAYEVIPLSFVTDWFHNGATFYDALTAEARSGKILAAWVTTTVTYDFWFTDQFTNGTGGVGANGGSRKGNVSGKWKRRRPASLADVRFKLRLAMNSKRVADGLALIHTFLATAKKR